jgi:thiaminase/transcriptional activator TenA
MDMTMHTAFSPEAWDRNARVYEIIRTMPFNAALAAGTLSEARFKHYITQDAHYLIGFGRALTLAGAKAPDPDRIVQFAKSAEGAIVVERALHGSFFQQYGITPEVFAHTPLSPACHHYVSYLLATAYAEPYEVLVGALLPCFWIYAEVGRDIHARAVAANPYQAWIDTYAGEEFHNAVRVMIAATDEAAEGASSSLRARMHAAFARATQLEWMFWDSAFRLEMAIDTIGFHQRDDDGIGQDLLEGWFALAPDHGISNPVDRSLDYGVIDVRFYSAAIRMGISRSRCATCSGSAVIVSAVSSLRTLNHSEYSAGTTSSVSTVATNRPPMMVIAMGPQKMLRASGIMPRIAARAVRTTGRARRTVASMIARCRP